MTRYVNKKSNGDEKVRELSSQLKEMNENAMAIMLSKIREK